MLADRIAHRYALALYQLANEKKSVERVLEDFKSIENLHEKSSDFRVLLRSPILTHEQKVPILKRLFEGKADPIVSTFIVILTKRSRENLLPQVIREYRSLYNTTHKITEADVISAHLLEPVLKNEIQLKLEKVLNNKVVLKEKIDTKLIGGFRIVIGSSLIDATVINSLRQIKKKLLV